MVTDLLNLVPPLVPFGNTGELLQTGRRLSSTYSPLDNTLAVFATNASTPSPSHRPNYNGLDGQPIYFAAEDVAPSLERRLFISDTSVIFAAFRNLTYSAREKGHEWNQTSEECGKVTRKLAMDYTNFTKECWAHTSKIFDITNTSSQHLSPDHYRCLYTCFSLFVALYVPEHGLEDAPVGDELMEWLNTHFIEPSSEEGDHLSSLEDPWEDETFWPYFIRTILRGLSKAPIFFLGVLSRHPSDKLQHLAQQLIPLLSDQPRLHEFSAERDFTYASHRWKDKLRSLRIELDRVPEKERYDGYDNWWNRFSCAIGILEGRIEVIKRACEDLGADWKEACVAWGIFVNPRLQRQEIPEIVSQVLKDMPPDPTNLEDMIHASLFSGDPLKTLEFAAQVDPWLAAHLADIMELLSLIDKEVDEDSGLTVRGHYVLAYASYLHLDHALWRITVSYMCSCGPIGTCMADELLVRVPLRLRHWDEGKDKSAESKFGENLKTGAVEGILKDVNATCFEYQREEARRVVCRIAAQAFVQNKEYGLALSYCLSSEDWLGLGRVVDCVLDEYLGNDNPEIFARYISDIAPSLQTLRTQPKAHGVFLQRLMFAVRFAGFYQRVKNEDFRGAAQYLVSMFQDEIAPKSWWGILLCECISLLRYNGELLFSHSEACLLLRSLEEVFTKAKQGFGADYLNVLMQKKKYASEQEALNRLMIGRLALAKYFARCTMRGL